MLVIIFLLAFVLRVYKISEYPAGLNADEAAIGYNAYSLLQTGKDEFGHSWPSTFQSFNDYKPGLYFYFVLPFVKILGLNELSVRLPSVILGTITVFLVYLLVKELGFSRISERIYTDLFPVVSAFLLAISPWHLHFSRGGWESNASIFFIIFGVFAFFKSLSRNWWTFPSVLSLILAMYTYHSARVIVPLLVVGLLILYFKKIFKQIKTKFLLMSVVLSVLFVIPLGISLLNKDTSSRFSGVGLFADQGPISRVNEQRGQHPDPYSIAPKILHNKIFEYFILFLNNYAKHFNGNYLFIFGDEIQRNKIPQTGQMYLIEILLIPLGLFFLVSKKPKNWQLPIWWLLVSPVASALTFQSPHAIRSLNMVVPMTIIVGYGIYNLLLIFKKVPKVRLILIVFLTTTYSYLVVSYLHQYYVHYPRQYPAAWEYGFKELARYVSEKESNFDKIYVTDKYDQPYILLAFYLKYPPKEFQKEAKLTPRDQYGFSTVEHFGKYYFGKIDQKILENGNKSMIIGSPEEIQESGKIVKRIYFLDGKAEAFRIIYE